MCNSLFIDHHLGLETHTFNNPDFLKMLFISISHNFQFLFFSYCFKQGLFSFLLHSCTPRPSLYAEDQVSLALELSPTDDRPVGSLVWCWKRIPVPLYELCIAGMCRRKGWACCGVSLMPFMSNLRRRICSKCLRGCHLFLLHSFFHLKEVCNTWRKLSISIPIYLSGSCLDIYNLKSAAFAQGTTELFEPITWAVKLCDK